MGKKTKRSHGISSSKEEVRDYVPGWFGGRLTSPRAQAAREGVQQLMRARVVAYVEARERAANDVPEIELEEPQTRFAP